MREDFDLALSNRYSVLSNQEPATSAQDKYDELLSAINEAAKETIGTRKRSTKTARASPATLSLIDLKDKARRDYISAKRGEKAILKREWKRLENEANAAFVADQASNLEETLREMKDAASRNQPARVWKLLRKVVGDDARRPIAVKSEHGNLSETKLMDEGRDYFSELLNNHSPHAAVAQPPPPAPKDEPSIPKTEFTIAEFVKAAMAMNNNRAPGSDDILTAELLKNGGVRLQVALLAICNDVFKGAKPPRQWTTNRICPIPKKGNQS